MSTKKKVLIIAGVVIAVSALGALSMRGGGDRGVQVSTEAVGRRTLVEVVTASGKIEPKRKVDISADISGRVVQAAVRRQVEAGNPSFPFGYQRQPLQASMSISLPLFDGLSRERRIEEARVAESDAQLAVRAEEQRLGRDVRTGVLNAQTAFRTAQLQRQVAENASEELRMARERFRLGAANSIEVTDAQTRLAEAERAVIDAVYMYHKSLAALEALVGRSLR